MAAIKRYGLQNLSLLLCQLKRKTQKKKTQNPCHSSEIENMKPSTPPFHPKVQKIKHDLQ